MARIDLGTRLKVVQSQPASDIQQAGDLFLLDCRARRLSPGTLDSYTRRMRSFQAWFAEQTASPGSSISRLITFAPTWCTFKIAAWMTTR